MKTKFIRILTLLLAFVVQTSFAQEKTITGTVTDDSGPLPGVSIMIKGTKPILMVSIQSTRKQAMY